MDGKGLARSIAWGIAISSAVLFGGSVIMMLVVTGRLWDGIAVGGFSAVWGGPGFGAMFGAGLHALRRERAEASAAEAAEAAIALPPVAGSGTWTM